MVVLRSFNNVLVDFASSLLGYPWSLQTLTDSLTLIKAIHSLYLCLPAAHRAPSNPPNQSLISPTKHDHLVEELNRSLVPIVRNQFISILLMLENILKYENSLLELKNLIRNNLPHLLYNSNQHHQSSTVFNLLNTAKFWSNLKALYFLMRPFLDILSQFESMDTVIPLVESTAYWIYLTNQLEISLGSLSLPDDFKQYVINLYNLKLEANNLLVHDIYKLALYLSPRYIKGLNLSNEIFFKSLLKFSCTFIQTYGYNEQDCTKLISQLIAYRNLYGNEFSPNNQSSNTNNIIEYHELLEFWQNPTKFPVNDNFQILKSLALITFNIISYIKGRGTNSSLQINGQFSKLEKYENFYPELKGEIGNSQFLSMIEAIRIHEFFAW